MPANVKATIANIVKKDTDTTHYVRLKLKDGTEITYTPPIDSDGKTYGRLKGAYILIEKPFVNKDGHRDFRDEFSDYISSIEDVPKDYRQYVQQAIKEFNGHGGRRRGAGRPAEPINGVVAKKKNYTIYCTESEIEFIRDMLSRYRAGDDKLTRLIMIM